MSFAFNHQTRIISGPVELDNIGVIAKSLNATHVLFVYDTFFKESNVVNNIVNKLKEKSIVTTQFSKVQPNPRDYDCEQGATIATDNQVDLIIALGGGSTMDEAKAIAALVTNGGKCSDWDGVDLQHPMLHTICIPTTAGTGADVTFCAVIDDTTRHFKMAFQDPINLIPTISLLDPKLTTTLPTSATVGPGMDVMTHAVEAYTVKVHNPISDALALAVIKIVVQNLKLAVDHPQDVAIREKLLVASSMAGMAFMNANVGAVHALSETIGAKYDLPHGMTNAALLVPIMDYNKSADPKRFAQIAIALGADPDGKSDEQLATEAVEKMKALTQSLHVSKLHEFDQFTESEFDEIAKNAMLNELTADNCREMTADGYVSVLKAAY